MKNRITLILIISIMTIFTSCKKDITIQNDGIVGSWKLVEDYDGYANGGTFTWHTITNDNSHTLTFSPNRQYKRIENFNGQKCVGAYTLLNSINLEINSNCNTVTEKMTISELTETTLIIDRQVREGKIRFKYLAIK